MGDLYRSGDEKNERLEFNIDKTISVSTMTWNPGGNGAAAESLPLFKVLRYGDLAFEGNRTKGHPYGKLVVNDIGAGIMSSRFRTLAAKQTPCVSFWKCFLLNDATFRSIYINCTKRGTLMTELVVPELLQSSVLLPTEAEQSEIGTFFTQLDSLITLHQRKCQYRGLYGYLSWEQRKLGEVATRHDNLRIPITAKDRIPGDTPYYGANGIQDYVEGYTHEGEFVLVAEDGATDLDNYPVQLISGLSWVNNHAHVIKAIPDVAQNRFIMYLIKSMDIASYLVGGTRSKLNAEVLMGIELKLPSNSEQIYIGALLSTLDSLITLHQRKYDKLCTVKKSMLDKMFPKPGETEPEIRFEGFTDPWEQRKFDDITYPAGEKNRDNLPYESYSVTNENGFIPQNEQFENGGTMATADKSMYYIVSKNSFAYNPARINVGSIGYYDKPENVIVSSLYEVFKTSEDIDDRFLWHWFKSDAFQRMIEQYQEGGVRLYFYYDKLCMCSLPVPDIQEQRKIGKQLDILDNLITLHQRKPNFYTGGYYAE